MNDEDVRSLEAFRSDPRVRAWTALDDRFGPTSEDIGPVLDNYDTVAAAGETTSEEINRDYRLDLESYADILEQLPVIEREVSGPPDPEEIETYADILEAEERSQAPTTTVWRFMDGE